MKEEAYISVDVETTGPIPGDYDLLSIGACDVFDPGRQFKVQLRPFAPKCDPEALAISGLNLEMLRTEGVAAGEAMQRFGEWVNVAASGRRPIFAGFNAPFDWSFVNWYFHHFLGQNPFGFTALDIKSHYMGVFGTTWSDTSASRLRPGFQIPPHKQHDCLADAIAQAAVLRRLLAHHGSAS